MRRRNQLHICGAILRLALVLALFTGVSAQAAQISLAPASVTASVGDTITLAVQADQAANLGGFQFGFTFDPLLLSVADVRMAGGFDTVVVKKFDNAGGSGMIAGLALATQLTGTSLPIASIDFLVKGHGVAAVGLTKVILGRIGGEEIPSSATGAVVTSNNYLLTVSSSGTGTGTITSDPAGIACGTNCSLASLPGNVVTLTATASADSAFIGWTGASCAGTGTCQVTMNLDKNVTAFFSTNAVDTTPPVLTISALSSGSTNTTPMNMAGTVSDANGIKDLAISGQTVTLSTLDNISYTFSHPVTLVTGTNVITSVATDMAGNTTTDERTIIYDTTSPVLVITAPADNSVASSPTVTVTGTVDETSTVLLQLNSDPTMTASMAGTSFNTVLTLAPGLNTINVYATDPAGNTTSGKRTVIYDDQKPALSITSPNADIITNQPDLTVSGIMSDMTAINVLVSCPTATVGVVSYPTATTWTVNITSMATGTNVITATATDGGNNTTVVIRNVLYDSMPPAVTLDPVSTPTNTPGQTISGTMELNSTVTVSCPTATVGVVSYSTTTWQADITLMTEGTNTFTITATDGAGNIATIVQAIVLEPSHTITATAGAGGTIVPLGTTIVPHNSSQAYYSITPNTGYHVADVLVDNSSVGQVSNYTFTNVTADHAISASFGVNTYTLLVDRSGTGSGTITSDPAGIACGTNCSLASLPGNVVTLTATASVDSAFIGWTGACVGAMTATCQVTMNSDENVTAFFGVNTYTLSVARSGNGDGTVTSAPAGISCGSTCSNGFTYATPVILSAASTTGSTFMGWSGACTGTGTCNVTITGTTPISAQFDDSTPPTLTISALPDNSITANTTINISGTVTDNKTIQSLLISGATVTVNQDNTFSHALLLSAGTNIVTTIAADAAGNQATDIRVITLDQTAPHLTITLPADNSVTNQAMSSVAGVVDETATVTVALNSGSTQTAVMSGMIFSTTVNLAAGMNNIDIAARDLAGNTSSEKRTITYDQTAPSVAITSPEHDITISRPTVTISGTISDTATQVAATMTVDGAASALTITAGTFSQAITFTAEGQHVITVIATDQAGNSATAQRNIIYAKLGDLDNSGAVDLIDALRAFKHSMGNELITDPVVLRRCDVAPLGPDGRPNPDGKIDIGDVIIILRKVVGLVNW